MVYTLILRSILAVFCIAVVASMADAKRERVALDSLVVRRLTIADSTGALALRLASSDTMMQFINARTNRDLIAAGSSRLRISADDRAFPVIAVHSSSENATRFELRSDAATSAVAVSIDCATAEGAALSVGNDEQKSELLIDETGDARVSSAVRSTMEARLRAGKDTLDAAWIARGDSLVLGQAARSGAFLTASTGDSTHPESSMFVNRHSGATLFLTSGDSKIAMESAPGDDNQSRSYVACRSNVLQAFAGTSSTRMAAAHREGRVAQLVANAHEAGGTAFKNAGVQWAGISAAVGMLLGTLTDGTEGVEAISKLPHSGGK
jgi:hypothetical protein